MAILVTSVQQNTAHFINSSEILTSVIRIQYCLSVEILNKFFNKSGFSLFSDFLPSVYEPSVYQVDLKKIFPSKSRAGIFKRSMGARK
jgi:hypothetical protein